MSTACEIVSGSTVYTTFVSTSTVYGTAVSSAPASTLTTSTSVVTSDCLLPTVLGDLALCSTSTIVSPLTTVIPGSVTTITSSSESLVTITQTSQGADRTTCSVVSVSTPSSSRAESTSAPSPSSSPSLASSEQPSPIASTSITYATTTITAQPSLSTASSASATPTSESSSSRSTREESSISEVSAVEAAESSAEAPVRRSTSYLTSWVTIVDASGRTTTSAETVPTLLNMPESASSSSNHVAAIAGGTVGGIAAFVLVGVVFFLMRKKRGCFGKGDDEIEDDVWDPAPHNAYYGGSTARRSGRGVGVGSGGGGVTAAGFGAALADEKAMDEDQRVDAATLERHQSWYKSLRGHGSELDHPDEAYGGVMIERSASPAPLEDPSGYNPQVLAYESPRPPRSSHGPQRSSSTRFSAQSHSSHSHEGPVGPAALSTTSSLDRRTSHLSQYGYYPTRAPPLPEMPAIYSDDIVRLPSPPGSHSGRPSPPFERMRSTSPNYTQLVAAAYAPSVPEPALARQRSLPALAIPPHMRSASYSGPHSARPSLGALQPHFGGSSGSGTSSGASSASPSRGRTDDSLSSGSESATGKGRVQSYSMPVLGYSQSDATIHTIGDLKPPATVTLAPEEHDHQDAGAKPKATLPTVERLKRPALDRADSAESLLIPTQWLGARVVNGDLDAASVAGRSVESLAT